MTTPKWRRWKNPAAIVFTIALLASISVHLPVYEVLGVLADVIRSESKKRPKPAVQVEFDIANAPVAQPKPDPVQSAKDAPKPAEEEPPAPPKAPPKKAQAKVALAEVAPPKTVKPPAASLQAIKQKSHDPNVTTPEDAKYIAKENQRVEEETVARVRSYTRDDPTLQPDKPSPSSAQSNEGNAETERSADSRDQEGEKRASTPKEARASARGASGAPPKALPSAEEPGGGSSPDTRAPSESAPAATPPAGRVVRDPFGSFTLAAVPAERTGRGGARNRRDAAGKAAGKGGAADSAGSGGGSGGGRGSGRGAGNGANLGVTWSAFEKTFGEEELKRERDDYHQQRLMRRSLATGGNRNKRWKEFRAAIENFVPNVRPGNQTALNAAASPFADYLTAVHRQLHQEFAEDFLPSLPGGAMSPYNDRALMTKLEIIINRDGTVHRVGVVESSGLMPFDYGAFASVMNGQPYPLPPRDILSGDGRVYFHWGFYRNERQCGTFNAEAYILPHPPGSAPAKEPFKDGPDWGGVIPDNATPQNPSGRRQGT